MGHLKIVSVVFALVISLVGCSRNDSAIQEKIAELDRATRSKIAELDLATQTKIAELDRTNQNKLAEAQVEIAMLEKEYGLLKSNQDASVSNAFHLAAYIMSDMGRLDETNSLVSTQLSYLENKYKTIELDPMEAGIQRLDSDTAIFFVSCKEAAPYLDGYKIKLSIGNPFFATYNDFELDVTWGGKEPNFNEMLTQASTNSGHYFSVLSDYEKAHATWEHSLRKKTCAFVQELKAGTWNEIAFDIAPAAPQEVRYILVSIRTKNVFLNTERKVSDSN